MDVVPSPYEATRPSLVMANRELLSRFIEREGPQLLPVLRAYVGSSRLYRPGDVAAEADSLLSEVVLEALSHAERFDADRAPRAWLLGIGANLIKRRREARAKRLRREPAVSDLRRGRLDEETDDEFLDRVAEALAPGPEGAAIAAAGARAILGLVSPEEQRVLRLAILYGYNGPELAKALGINPSNARVRLSRILARLRQRLAQLEWEQHGNA